MDASGTVTVAGFSRRFKRPPDRRDVAAFDLCDLTNAPPAVRRRAHQFADALIAPTAGLLNGDVHAARSKAIAAGHILQRADQHGRLRERVFPVRL